jgi:pyruvate formate lyase activating enzyme
VFALFKECVLYEKLGGAANAVKCTACSHYCRIVEGNYGACGVRKNQGGKLLLAVYGKAIAVEVDPIEKKPLFHFLPGSTIYSLGTVGCNFACAFCRNWQISQATRLARGQAKTALDATRALDEVAEKGMDLSPEQIVKNALAEKCKSIAFTYTEPTIALEYAFDTFALARKHGLKTVFVSNGFTSPEAVGVIAPVLDANNIDLKSFREEFYRDVCKARLQPVLDSIKAFHEKGVWLEVTTLVIPGLNDSLEELAQIAGFLASVDKRIPWHVTAFYPEFKMLSTPPTPPQKLLEARDIGLRAGLEFVYVGNVFAPEAEGTFCPKCKTKIIDRIGFESRVEALDARSGACAKCGEKIPGIWA